MALYNFEVVRRDGTIVASRTYLIPNQRAVWAHIAELAGNVEEPGCRIRVTNEAREMVILIGVTAARRTTAVAA